MTTTTTTIKAIPVSTTPKTLTRRRRKDGKRKIWSYDQKLQCAVTYTVLGSWVDTSLTTGVPVITLKSWRNAPWWREMLDQVRRDDLDKLNSNMQRVIKKALAATEDRLDNGNHLFDQKTGKIIRIPVNLKDTLKVSTELMARQDKQRELEKMVVAQDATAERLLKLADEFARFAKAKEVIDVPLTIDVVPSNTTPS